MEDVDMSEVMVCFSETGTGPLLRKEQTEEVRQYIKEVRDALREALPEAEERISWSMPTYWKKHNIIQFAGFKNHVGLYTGPEAVLEISERLKGYKTSKGSIQLPYSGMVPVELVR